LIGFEQSEKDFEHSQGISALPEGDKACLGKGNRD
jgi:hypothetical protein